MIIAGFAGIGKTTLCRKYPNLFLDIESSKYKWENTLGTKEEEKGLLNRTRNINYPSNYLSEILEQEKKYTGILVSCGKDIISALNSRKLKYLIYHPNLNNLKSYIARYKDRGNNNLFINSIISNYSNRISHFKSLPNSVELDYDETLEERLIKEGYLG